MSDDIPAACIIGWPVAHSKSPLIHQYWLERYGIAGAYRREEVRPEDFADFVAGLAARGYLGANVTLPHKEAALACAEPDERARAVGAANTLWLDDGQLRATNTDVEGFLGALEAAAPDWYAVPGHAVVLGAGGAARAIVYALVESGFEPVHVVNRTLSRAEAVRDLFGPFIKPVDWRDASGVLRNAGLLINATSLGMTGKPALEIELGALVDGAVVMDIVYTPLRTPLLVAAERRGLRTVDGLAMLLHQAVGGFELWFGVRPEVTKELRAIVEGDLAKQ